MLLIMVGNMASIFTQVYIAKVTPIYSFFPHLLHTVPFTSLSLLWAHVDIFMVIFICSCHRPNVQWGFCLHFGDENSAINPTAISGQKSRWTYFFLVCLVEVVFTKYQRMYFHALTEKQPTSYFIHIWSWWSTPFMYLLYCWMFCTWFTLDHIMTHSPVCVNISWVLICTDKSYNSIVLPYTGHQVWAAILVWSVSTMDHSTRFTNTLWKILLIHSYCPIAVCFTSQQVLQ